MNNVHVIKHPIVQHKLTILRDKTTDSGRFRSVLEETSQLLCYEAMRDWNVIDVSLETGNHVTGQFTKIDTDNIAFVSILRAGNGMLNGVLDLLPTAHAGHIGLYREPKTKAAIEYYFKLPQDMESKHAIVLDPMLATGHTSVAAVNRLKDTNPLSIIFIAVVTSPEGLEYFQSYHPEIRIYTASIDEKLNDNSYIVPGLGDAGDRMWGTI